jgi:hypothetical protein
MEEKFNFHQQARVAGIAAILRKTTILTVYSIA